MKLKIVLFDVVFSLENDHNSQQIISSGYNRILLLVCTHTKWSETAAAVFLAVGEYHLSSHNSIVLLYSMSIFYHQTTALSYAEKERKMPGATSNTTVLLAW